MSLGTMLRSVLFIPAFLNSATASAATWYVSSSVAQSGDGTSWGTAFKRIQGGIDAAFSGDTVIVAEGTYVENIRVKAKNVILQSIEPTNSGVVANTVIDGNEAGSVVTFLGSETEACVLSGFTIRNGVAENGAGICGGSEGKPTHATIRNNTIRDNWATANGGGLYGCAGTIENNMITGNSADDEGGGLYGCNGMVRNNIISDNGADYGAGLSECDGTILNNSIWNNQRYGLTGCDGLVEDNLITGSNSFGLYWCKGIIRDNVITANGVPWGGALLSCYDGTISGNVITANGGGLWGTMWRCGGTIEHNFISGNTGGPGDYPGQALEECWGTIQYNTVSGSSGYGIHGYYPSYDATIQYNVIVSNGLGGLCGCRGTIRNNIVCGNKWYGLVACTGDIANNTVCNNGDFGVWDCSGTIRNCIVWGNKGGLIGSQVLGQLPSHSCIQGWGKDQLGNIGGDPRFVDPDGPDDNPETYEDNDYRLLPDSPCIDAGMNEDWMWQALDLEGNARICKGASSLAVDMGAYEFFRASIVKVEKTGEGDVQLTWTSQEGESYTVWSRLDLLFGDWTPEAEKIRPQGPWTSWAGETSGRMKFYRVEALK
jgi:hypothetical protein